MSIAESLLPSFDAEMAKTRQVLERVPDDKLEWRAHPKSNTIGWCARHLAEIPSWTGMVLSLDSLDIDPPGGMKYKTTPAVSRAEVLETFDANVIKGREALAAASDETLQANWSLMKAGQTMFALPRVAVLRDMVIHHSIHHRAHLCVYLRLNDVPVPGLYGPSGDETW